MQSFEVAQSLLQPCPEQPPHREQPAIHLHEAAIILQVRRHEHCAAHERADQRRGHREGVHSLSDPSRGRFRMYPAPLGRQAWGTHLARHRDRGTWRDWGACVGGSGVRSKWLRSDGLSVIRLLSDSYQTPIRLPSDSYQTPIFYKVFARSRDKEIIHIILSRRGSNFYCKK